MAASSAGRASGAGTRRRSRLRVPHWRALTTLPPTATPRGTAIQTSWLFAVGAAVLFLVTVVPLDSAANRSATAAVGVVAACVSLAVRRRGSLGRVATHVVLGLSTGSVFALTTTTADPVLSMAFSGAFIVAALATMTTCSWAASGVHVAVILCCLGVQPRIHPDSGELPTLLMACFLVLGCSFAGVLGRTAATAEGDVLTGLLNRRGAERQLGAVLEGRRPLSVALVDLDRFKTVNDELGHAAGDELLREVAALLRSAVRAHLGRSPDVLVSRWGGDEFVLAAAVDADRLAVAVDDARARLGAAGSFSAGIAEVRPGESAADALRVADAAMYGVKRSRRGRTAVSDDAAGDDAAGDDAAGDDAVSVDAVSVAAPAPVAAPR